MSENNEIKVPDIGDVSEVDVIEVLVSEGDTISKEQSIITVESDKASMEIPAPLAGVVKSMRVKVGDKVSEGSVILEMEPAKGQSSAERQEAGTPKRAEQSAAGAKAGQATEQPSQAKAQATPADTSSGAARPSGAKAIVAVPDIGDASDVEVIEIMVAVGDTVAVDQSLITVESDKASMEVPSSHAGVVTAIRVKLGDKVNEGTEILELELSGDDSSSDAAGEPASVAAEDHTNRNEVPSAEPAQESGGLASVPPTRHSPTEAYADADVPLRNLPHASPSVRKFARELGVKLANVTGSGAKNRITADDVRRYVKQALANGVQAPAGTGAPAGGLSVLDWPKIDFTKFGPVKAQPLSRIKKIAGANLHRNWVMIPHVTNQEVADITELEELRKTLNKENEKTGSKVTMLAFIVTAVVAALKKFPEFNASLDGDNLVLKQYYHIGFAADTPHGLVVPVIRDADKKGVFEIAKEMGELAKLARDGKLSPTQMQGGCFSISSLGGIGGTSFTPIINAPEVAILGVSRSSMQPVWDGKNFQPRLTLPLSLSYDHRVIDGAAAARFNAFLATVLADFRRIAL